MIDTHCHLLDSSQAYSFYRPIKPHPILSMSTLPSQWSLNQNLSLQYPEVFYSVGIHPWYVQEQSLFHLQTIDAFLNDSKCLAIGEIGLDFSPKHKINAELQMAIFTRQCAVAQEINLPVSIHAVKCHNQMLGILKRYSLQGVIHGLSASQEICHEYLKLGFKIGVNAQVCNTNARRIREMVTNLPLEVFVLETDFPNITESLELDLIANEMAVLADSLKDEVIAQTTYNALHIYNFPR